MKVKHLILYFSIISLIGCSEKNDSTVIADIFKSTQTDTSSYHTLRVLSKQYGKRLAGTPASIEALMYLKRVMDDSNFDTVYLQECTVAHWKRGEDEVGKVYSAKSGVSRLSVCTLGNSVGTPPSGIKAEVIEAKSFEELGALGDKVKGKIVFFNKPMDTTKVNTFSAYGEVVGFRFSGASVAAKYGAIAVIVRSVTTSIDTFPHTGVMRYSDTPKEIPAFSVSTIHANLLSKMLSEDPKLKLFLKSECKLLPDEKSYNVVGEVKGSKFPDEIITVGGHVDVWDIAEGAHDDGGGCVQSLDVWRIFKDVDYKPKRTLRIVMFIDEEMNQRGGQKYAELAKQYSEKHLFALESDGGCDKPLGFSIESDTVNFKKVQVFSKLFEPYGVNKFVNGGSGVDIGPLKERNAVLSEMIADPTHYFDFHHSGNDTFENVDKTSLQQGSAAMAALIYLVDKHGLK
jgi:carboxypeptidase Q